MKPRFPINVDFSIDGLVDGVYKKISEKTTIEVRAQLLEKCTALMFDSIVDTVLFEGWDIRVYI